MSDRTDTEEGSGAGLDRIRAARQEPGPITRKGSGPIAWFDPRRRRLGQLAFSLNRITGLALVGYLYLGALGSEEYATSGNQGLLDIVDGLKWVRENIMADGVPNT